MTAFIRSRMFRLRPAARQIHLWISLLVGLPIAILSAAGLPVTYWNETDSLFARDFFPQQAIGAERLSFDAIVASARSAPGVVRVDSISFTGPRSVAIVSAPLAGMEEREIAVEPSSGRVVGVRDRHRAVVEWFYSLHTRLMLDRVGADREGQLLVVGLAICTIALIMSGILLWWPGRLAWSSISPIVRRSRLWRDLHTKTGIYSLPAVALASLTAILLSFPSTRSTAGEVTSYASSLSTGDSPMESPSLEHAVQTAIIAAPGLRFAVLMNIDATTKPLIVGVGDDARGYRWVAIDRRSGAVIDVRSEALREGAHPGFLIGLHQGHRFGQLGQLIFALSSLVPMLLYVTGIYLWWQRRNRTRIASLRASNGSRRFRSELQSTHRPHDQRERRLQ